MRAFFPPVRPASWRKIIDGTNKRKNDAERTLLVHSVGFNSFGERCSANAQAWHEGERLLYDYDRLSPEKQTKYGEILKAYHDKVAPLMEKMMARRLELHALAGSANADSKRITALAEEIAASRMQLNQERWALTERLRSELCPADQSSPNVRRGEADPRALEKFGHACDGAGCSNCNRNTASRTADRKYSGERWASQGCPHSF